FYETDAELKEMQRSLVVTLLPGSRVPEANENWRQIVQATDGFLETFTERKLLFLGAIAPALSLDPLREILQGQGWHQQALESTTPNLQFEDEHAIAFTKKNATLILTQNDYNLCLLKGDCCIAMAGTATEQFVGLGKPAIAMPGKGPQYTPAFAEAQTRLLGPSLILVEQPQKVATVVQQLLRDPDWLQLIADNGFQRMGQPGAASRIADCLMKRLMVEGWRVEG
ncbi:lipid-A-disaccharide synthase-related protein, partial [Allocoleopsis sp.]|uniref:lipid-A-disaccharide synthase-related protein n=1 Tax=Allocoleopsis sp. TaxID=3088169 RepID=UPI002FD5D08B